MTDYRNLKAQLRDQYLKSSFVYNKADNALADMCAEAADALDAMEREVASLKGNADALVCPECGKATGLKSRGCEVCGATLSLENFATCCESAEAEVRWLRETLEKFKAAPELLDAAKDFVAKVDRGEARSVRSYAKFKAAIAKAAGEKS